MRRFAFLGRWHLVSWGFGAGILAALVMAGAGSPALGNGDSQREVEGRVVRVDPRAGTLVVAREFRGKTTSLTLRAQPGTVLFACGGASATLDRLKPGMTVSVFYEVVGNDGVANIVVVEGGP
jgi:hypothetical protein